MCSIISGRGAGWERVEGHGERRVTEGKLQQVRNAGSTTQLMQQQTATQTRERAGGGWEGEREQGEGGRDAHWVYADE